MQSRHLLSNTLRVCVCICDALSICWGQAAPHAHKALACCRLAAIRRPLPHNEIVLGQRSVRRGRARFPCRRDCPYQILNTTGIASFFAIAGEQNEWNFHTHTHLERHGITSIPRTLPWSTFTCSDCPTSASVQDHGQLGHSRALGRTGLRYHSLRFFLVLKACTNCRLLVKLLRFARRHVTQRLSIIGALVTYTSARVLGWRSRSARVGSHGRRRHGLHQVRGRLHAAAGRERDGCAGDDGGPRGRRRAVRRAFEGGGRERARGGHARGLPFCGAAGAVVHGTARPAEI